MNASPSFFSKKPSLDTRAVSLTPEMAQELLDSIEKRGESIKIKQRTVSNRTVQDYALQISTGQWALNGEPIIISDKGYLLDGQHRCRAVIEAGSAIDVMIVSGVDESTMATIDQNRVRSHSDVLTMSGFSPKLSTILATATRMELTMLATGNLVKGSTRSAKHELKETPQDVLAYIEKNPKFVKACEWANDQRKTQFRLYSLPALAWLKYRMTEIDSKLIDQDQWLDNFVSGANLNKSDHRLWIRSRITKEAISARKTDNLTRLCWMIKAFNAQRTGLTYSSLQGLLQVSNKANTVRLLTLPETEK